VRSHSTTEEGLTLVALCGTLSVCFSDQMWAEILQALVQSRKPGMTPSLNQWKCLARSCAGIFAATSFPLKAEGLMRMQSRDVLERNNATADPRAIK